VRTKAIILILFCCARLSLAEEEGFDRYKIILDKHPFGEEPPEAETVQVPFSQSFARHLRLSMLFESSEGELRVGVIDSKNNKGYTLSIGEAQDGLELLEADLAAEEATLQKGAEVVLFKLESGATEQLSRSQQAARRSSYADRRKARLAAARKNEPKKPPEPRLTGEALKKHLENVQMDAIRNGLPPLPLTLTKEMDDQLVAEKVLRPQ